MGSSRQTLMGTHIPILGGPEIYAQHKWCPRGARLTQDSSQAIHTRTLQSVPSEHKMGQSNIQVSGKTSLQCMQRPCVHKSNRACTLGGQGSLGLVPRALQAPHRHGWSFPAGNCASGWAKGKNMQKRLASPTCHSVRVSSLWLTLHRKEEQLAVWSVFCPHRSTLVRSRASSA